MVILLSFTPNSLDIIIMFTIFGMPSRLALYLVFGDGDFWARRQNFSKYLHNFIMCYCKLQFMLTVCGSGGNSHRKYLVIKMQIILLQCPTKLASLKLITLVYDLDMEIGDEF